MPVILVRTLAAGLSILIFILSRRILPPYMDQGLYQFFLLVMAAIIFSEGAYRRRLILFDARYGVIVLGFICAIGLSFSISDISKYETGAGALNRCLWIAPLLVSYMVYMHDKRSGRTLMACASLCLPLLAWRTHHIDGDEISRLTAAGLIGGVFFLAGWVLKMRDEPPAFKKTFLAAAVLVAVFYSAWTGVNRVRLGGGEIEVVRKNRQMENVILDVSTRSFKEHPLLGAGPASTERNFLRMRPPYATLQGIPERMGAPKQSVAVLKGESGNLGLILILALIFSPVVLLSRKSPPEQSLLFGSFGLFVAHDLMGGGWLLTHAGAAIFFCILGLMLAPNSPREGHPLPTSLFIASLIVIGGTALLQQMFWWKIHTAEQQIKVVRWLLNERRLDEAAQEVDNILLLWDPHRNELISMMIGGFVSTGQIDKALANSLLLLQRDPDYPAVKSNICAFYAGKGNLREALSYFKEHTMQNPTTENLSKLGHLYVATGQTETALKTFTEAVALFPRETELFLVRSARMMDTPEQGRILLEAAAFSVNVLMRHLNEKTDLDTMRWAVNTYKTPNERLKVALGMTGK